MMAALTDWLRMSDAVRLRCLDEADRERQHFLRTAAERRDEETIRREQRFHRRMEEVTRRRDDVLREAKAALQRQVALVRECRETVLRELHAKYPPQIKQLASSNRPSCACTTSGTSDKPPKSRKGSAAPGASWPSTGARRSTKPGRTCWRSTRRLTPSFPVGSSRLGPSGSRPSKCRRRSVSARSRSTSATSRAASPPTSGWRRTASPVSRCRRLVPFPTAPSLLYQGRRAKGATRPSVRCNR